MFHNSNQNHSIRALILNQIPKKITPKVPPIPALGCQHPPEQLRLLRRDQDGAALSPGQGRPRPHRRVQGEEGGRPGDGGRWSLASSRCRGDHQSDQLDSRARSQCFRAGHWNKKGTKETKSN